MPNGRVHEKLAAVFRAVHTTVFEIIRQWFLRVAENQHYIL